MTISHEIEKGQNRLNLVVGILTVFQVAGVIYEFSKETEYQVLITAITFIVGFALLFIIMYLKRIRA